MKTTMLKLILELSCLAGLSCDQNTHANISQDIAEAKQRGVLIAEYTANPNPYKLNDTLPLHVKEAWIENHWVKSGGANSTHILQGYQLCINTEKEDIEGIDLLRWTIGINGDHYIRTCSLNSLVGDFAKLPGDTITYVVQLGDMLSDSHEVKKIGQLILIRKK
ncbi:MAG: hypothetical protein ACHQRM_00155 [Bacteroidia bacterium]